MFKFLNKLDYLLKETLVGLQRGGWMNWAAVSTVTVLLLILNMSLQTSWQLEKLLNSHLAPGNMVVFQLLSIKLQSLI